jgi:hypothetical protein
MQLLSAALHGTLGSYLRSRLCRRAALTLWHAFVLLGLKIFPSSILLYFAWWPPLLFLVRFFFIYCYIYL